jgi:hypothetical protein
MAFLPCWRRKYICGLYCLFSSCLVWRFRAVGASMLLYRRRGQQLCMEQDLDVSSKTKSEHRRVFAFYRGECAVACGNASSALSLPGRWALAVVCRKTRSDVGRDCRQFCWQPLLGVCLKTVPFLTWVDKLCPPMLIGYSLVFRIGCTKKEKCKSVYHIEQ